VCSVMVCVEARYSVLCHGARRRYIQCALSWCASRLETVCKTQCARYSVQDTVCKTQCATYSVLHTVCSVMVCVEARYSVL
jgi:hypothetical protein